jgi:hypothetical protein
MRTEEFTEIEWLKFATPEQLRDTYVQSADASDLEVRANQALVALAEENLALDPDEGFAVAFVDIAGGGDGHTFVARFFSASNIDPPPRTEAEGIDPALARIFFYQGAQSEALANARAAVNARIAALFENDDVDSIRFLQTGFAGASQGSFCGFVLVALTPVNTTLSNAVLSGGNVTITGTNFLSTIPNTQTYVEVSGPGIGTTTILTESQIVAGGGSVSDTSIVIPVALLGTVAVGDTVAVSSNGSTEAFFTIV